MHIAFLTPEFPHAKVAYAAGIATSINNLANALVSEGASVTVFVYGQKTQEIIVENGVSIHLIKNKKFKFLSWFFYRKYIQNYCNVIIKKEKIDLIEAPDWTGITAFMKFKAPLIIRFHGSDTYFCHLENRKQKKKNFWFEKKALQKAKACIAPTTFAGALSKELFKIKNKEIKTIHNGLELEKFTNYSAEDYQKGLMLYIGTLIRKKGVLELPEIFAKVRNQFPEAKLVLIGADSNDIKTGSASTWQLVKERFRVEDLKNIEYLGKIPYEEVRNYIQKANVCIFPTFAETLGMVTIESMAMQKVVVNSNIGWSQELIEDEESGFLVHPANHNLYAERIVQVLKDQKITLEIGKQARLRIEDKFDIKKLVKENIEFYCKIIKSNK
ncbi:glycosyltransferase family 4 protein [Flavobacterium johnsoniae]|uniref:Candidate alpha-glycosyltransferase Glycosyltransferase family 4 n=1 Tax=Flavobacterium johnsoniae (strain ATCC 17061 / DSM 2064 / JCM 8514 / BCRC 14874 / CCUG 350202 / NBRC 14942 / NCIMB 11054 / UW101) TaxID=376686 RepID=A5FN87_FLAJ1|nr:glycosyltransferase family 4 protein [Flavobacterium johnsoniae]ABQ03335.1 Candidate alpha-glycosyltransferase; Glycosyltransferase family 4 [Flavobacterium johnsoniae UW101]OXG01247.1 glycosyl transferase family 1 [Flavobacterium johnsoniae UW101]WQG79800.1 glycosyltransferase family 4 protein [Flavobacterium johnsoniae UW101]SHL78253.1 Glycosyltransferase involved in cell wall bisynthesis [Flavobacterium johnsoniae]